MAKNIEYPEIRGFIPTSLIEWKGHLSAIVFLPGCNWRCPYCHGWKFFSPTEEVPEIQLSEVLRMLGDQNGWLDGIVISGGEPTLQPKLENLIALFREKGLKIKLHSNGSHPEVLRELIDQELLECLALDYKVPLHQDLLTKIAGVKVEAEKVQESFALAATAGLELEFHTTLCPSCLSKQLLATMAADLASITTSGEWVWQQYNPKDVLDIETAGREQFEAAEVAGWADELRAIYPNINLRDI
ncbi:MAG: anaerobic ribonucleoside-triphosphate reductase activating protein [Planctomycetes bacterium]|nr:anaerobic ribonucleoside-triphosphate reductase activating protein [Planctomycetota bacterium]